MTSPSPRRKPRSVRRALRTPRTPRRAGKHLYSFGPSRTDGDKSLRNLLGGKGANLAEMCRMGLPVPPGFTISTEVCAHFTRTGGRYPKGLEREVSDALARVEREVG